MRQIVNFGDQRQTGICAYCGGSTDTRDHVPSRVFLDEPYPENLPIAFACLSCNQGFSLDEEYVACLLECASIGSIIPERLNREKIRQILRRKPLLVERLRQAQQESSDQKSFNIETDRIKNVLLKLARGHAVFELNEPQIHRPAEIFFTTLPLMNSKDRTFFEEQPVASCYPEVGSRTMQSLVSNQGIYMWIDVQAGRYRYLAIATDRIIIRLVIGEYLACQVVW